MEQTLAALLLADAGVAAIAGARVTWSERDQAAGLPALVLHRISGVRDYHMGGPSGLVSSRVQADCWAHEYGQAMALKQALVAAINGLSLNDIQACFIDAERHSVEKASNGAEKYHRASIDFIIWHAE